MGHYNYLGAAAPVSFVPTPTKEGDGFSELFAVYAGAFPEGSPERINSAAFARALCAANGVPYKTAAVESWIFGLSQKRRAFDSKNNPGMYGGPKGVGWAYFAEGNTIKLPDFPRAGLPVVGKEEGKAAGASTGGEGEEPWWASPWVYGGAAVALIAFVSLYDPKKKREARLSQAAS